MQEPEAGHDPVMLNEVLDLLQPAAGEVFVDCTTGRAGHALAIAHRVSPDGLLLAMDADPRNLEYAQQRLADTPCRLFHANFAELTDVLEKAGIPAVDGIFADLGLSTNQFLDPAYGMSFSSDAPLDMRIDPRSRETAADIVNKYRQDDLANVLYKLADERYSRRIARKIVESRRTSPINSTERLAELVRLAIPRSGASEKIDPATRTFMALRMKVNREVENLAALMDQAPKFLKPGGRLGVISFHSVEDRAVKQAFRFAEQTGLLKVLTKKPLTPSDAEIAENPRARSAKLRVAQRTR